MVVYFEQLREPLTDRIDNDLNKTLKLTYLGNNRLIVEHRRHINAILAPFSITFSNAFSVNFLTCRRRQPLLLTRFICPPSHTTAIQKNKETNIGITYLPTTYLGIICYNYVLNRYYLEYLHNNWLNGPSSTSMQFLQQINNLTSAYVSPRFKLTTSLTWVSTP